MVTPPRLRRLRGREFAVTRELAEQGLTASIDYFGESVTGPGEAERVTASYLQLAGTLTDAAAGTFVSLDLSHIGLDQPGDPARERLARIADAVPAGARVQVGAEQAERADRILESVLAAARTSAPVSATVQANLKRSLSDANRLAEAGVPIRLVKGVPRGTGNRTRAGRLPHVACDLAGRPGKLALSPPDKLLRVALVLPCSLGAWQAGTDAWSRTTVNPVAAIESRQLASAGPRAPSSEWAAPGDLRALSS